MKFGIGDKVRDTSPASYTHGAEGVIVTRENFKGSAYSNDAGVEAYVNWDNNLAYAYGRGTPNFLDDLELIERKS